MPYKIFESVGKRGWCQFCLLVFIKLFRAELNCLSLTECASRTEHQLCMGGLYPHIHVGTGNGWVDGLIKTALLDRHKKPLRDGHNPTLLHNFHQTGFGLWRITEKFD